jgi:hypothetical protein
VSSVTYPREFLLASVSVPVSLVEEYLIKDKEYDNCLSGIAKLEKDIENLKDNVMDVDKSPQYESTMAKLAVAKKALVACRDKVRPQILQQLRDKALDDAERRQLAARARVDFLEKLKEVLQNELENQLASHRDFNRKPADVEWLKEEIRLTEALVDRVGKMVIEAEIEIWAQRWRVNAFDEAIAVP